MKLTRSQWIILSGVSITLLLVGICVPVGVVVYKNNHKDNNNDTSDITTTPMTSPPITSTIISSTSTTTVKSSTTTSMNEITKVIVKDLNGLKDTIAKFQDDLGNLMNDEKKQMAKLFREEVEHFKSTTQAKPGQKHAIALFGMKRGKNFLALLVRNIFLKNGICSDFAVLEIALR